MLFVRPGRLADLDALEHMARTAQPVLHSLPHDRRALEARVALSEDSFRADADFPGEEFYLFVLEDAQSGKLMGTASIVAAAGYSDQQVASARARLDGMSVKRRQELEWTIISGLPAAEAAYDREKLRRALVEYEGISAADLRANLVAFLKEVAPVAQENGIRLAIHPDDPP